MKRLLPLALQLLLPLFGLFHNAFAQEGARHLACSDNFPHVAPPDSTIRAQEIERLRLMAPSCLGRADYYAYQGQLHYMQGRYLDALMSIERSILLDSSQLGVQLDYVMALAKTGSLGAAQELAKQILGREDMPPTLRATLEDVLKAHVANPAHDLEDKKQGLDLKDWRWRGSVQALLGRDLNLNTGIKADYVYLTLPNENLYLPLDASSKPKAGTAALASAQMVGESVLDDGHLLVQGTWVERVVPNSSEYAIRQQDASILYRPASQDTWLKRIAASRLELGGRSLLNTFIGTTWREYQALSLASWATKCRYILGFEGERRFFVQDGTLNGLYGGALSGLLCDTATSEYQLGIQAGRDWAVNPNRAGGHQTRLDLKAHWGRNWSWGRITMDAFTSSVADSDPYSDLLGGVTRRSLRQSYRATYTKRLDTLERFNTWGGIYWVTALEKQKNQSNINLFSTRGGSIYNGLRFEF